MLSDKHFRGKVALRKI